MEPWDLIREHRLALADRLDTLTAAQWATASLCKGWTVKDVVAHLMVGPTSSGVEFARAMLAARGSFHRANQILVARRADQSAADLTGQLRAQAGSRFTPPMLDWHAPLTDLLVHREDIGLPLGWPPQGVGAAAVGDAAPEEDRSGRSWAHALEFLAEPRGRVGFVPRPLPAVRLMATDLGWSHGSGPEVRGPAVALGLAMVARPVLLHELAGPGAAGLRAWVEA